MSPILKVGPVEAAEDAEIDFELAWLASLTTAERFEMMFRKSREMAEELTRRAHRKPVEVVERA